MNNFQKEDVFPSIIHPLSQYILPIWKYPKIVLRKSCGYLYIPNCCPSLFGQVSDPFLNDVILQAQLQRYNWEGDVQEIIGHLPSRWEPLGDGETEGDQTASRDGALQEKGEPGPKQRRQRRSQPNIGARNAYDKVYKSWRPYFQNNMHFSVTF